jgi:hypothetical protein
VTDKETAGLTKGINTPVLFAETFSGNLFEATGNINLIGLAEHVVSLNYVQGVNACVVVFRVTLAQWEVLRANKRVGPNSVILDMLNRAMGRTP